MGRPPSHGESGPNSTPEYLTWKHMLHRCRSSEPQKARTYRNRGISVCPQWKKSYPAFLSYIGRKPSPDCTLDRIDNERGYEPGNVRWATQKEQANNRRDSLLTVRGVTLTRNAWSKKFGVPQSIIKSRLNFGWRPEDAVKKPPFRSGLRSEGKKRPSTWTSKTKTVNYKTH